MKNSHEHILFKTAWNINEKMSNLLGQCYAFIQAITNTPIRPDYREQLLSVSLRRGALATTAIEGNTLSELDLDRLETGESLPPGRQYMQKEVQNILDALNILLKESIIGQNQEPTTINQLRRFHEMVGKDLGDAYGELGHFRRNNVIVGKYRPPSFENVDELVRKFCDWLLKEFHYTKGQNFDEAVLQAIVSHVYLVWIHPFSDGNGRTARLLEFNLLLRAGVPDIASHLLSNHYNNTRDQYYRELQHAEYTGNLTDFILYALEGFRDGLEYDVLRVIHNDQIDMTWKNYVHDKIEKLRESEKKSEKIMSRVKILAYYIPADIFLSVNQIKTFHTHIFQVYNGYTYPTLKSDLDFLVKHNLLVTENEKYRSNKDVLRTMMSNTNIIKHY